MTRMTLRGLAGRKLRTALTALAIVLGVAMVSGTYVLTDTIDRAFTSIFSATYVNSEAVITAKGEDAVVPDSVLARVRALPSVADAGGSIMDLDSGTTDAEIAGAGGKPLSEDASPTFGMGVDPAQEQFNPLKLKSGEWAGRSDQVVLDAGTASDHDLHPGDRVRIAVDGPSRPYTVSGVARFGDVDSLGGATIAAFDVATARRLFAKDGFDQVHVAARDGVPAATVRRDLRRVLPAGVVVRSGDEQASSSTREVSEFMTYFRYFLLAFGAIALFVGAFVIFNTLTITVAQRTRELATLRTLGASRRFVRASVVLEALVVGLSASAVGLVAGIGLARLLSSLFDKLGMALPEASTVVEPRTVVVSLVAGTVVTVIASLVPALRATRIAPIAAVREGSVLPPARGARIGARLVRVLVPVVGWPARRFGGTAGRLAGANATRNPARTASTAGALMVGLALVTAVAVLGTGLRGAAEDAVSKQVASSHVVTSDGGFEPISVEAGRSVAAVPGVSSVTAVRSDSAKAAGGKSVGVSGVDPATIASGYRFIGSSGRDASALRAGEAIVRSKFASDHGLSRGSRFALTLPSGKRLSLTVAGIYAPPKIDSLVGSVVVSQAQFDRAFARPRNAYVFVSGASTAALSRSLSGFPGTKVESRDGFVETRSEGFAKLLNLLYVLLAFSVVVSLFGMVNTLVLSVFERTRELGMLRAIGMSRRQVRRMVRWESVITALIGAVLGLAAGLAVAAVVVRLISALDVSFVVPVPTLAALTLVAALAGVAAAVLPARRAGRLDVLHALRHE